VPSIPPFFGLLDFLLRRSRFREEVEIFMIAVVGNVIAGLGVISLFTATLRLTRVR
jgi:hypothetical protein